MAKHKINFNWYFLIVGIILFYFGLPNNQTTSTSDYKKITVELYKDMSNANGRGSSIDYKFWTKEYKNQFNILKGSISSGKHQAIANLKSGQVVDLYITATDFENLSDEKKDITVIGISLFGNPLMTKDEFYHNQELYETRLNIFSLFVACMLILNGLLKIPNKLNYIIVGFFILTVIIMRIFEVGIY